MTIPEYIRNVSGRYRGHREWRLGVPPGYEVKALTPHGNIHHHAYQCSPVPRYTVLLPLFFHGTVNARRMETLHLAEKNGIFWCRIIRTMGNVSSAPIPGYKIICPSATDVVFQGWCG